MKNLLKVLFLSSILFTACDSNPDNGYAIPSRYNFDNVSYNGQTQRLSMLTEIKAYLATGTSLDANKLKAMYANDATNAGFTGTYDDSKQLKSKTFENQTATFEGLMDEAETASQSVVIASNGTAGISTNAGGDKNYLVSGGGLEYAEVIEKGLMGACFYYQATSVYLGTDKMNVDNETIVEGQGTKMEHHWDEAFGYLGAPIDFPSSTEPFLFWAKYSDNVNSKINTSQKLMSGFLKGRAAIHNNALEARDEAIPEIRIAWEEVVAGSAILFINDALETNDMATKFHSLSQAVAFIYSLQFNETKTLTNAQVSELLTLIGENSNFSLMNFYNTSNTNLEEAKTQLGNYFNWDASILDAL